MQRGPKVPFNAMCVLRRFPLFFAASLFLFAGCAPKVSTPLPGGEFVHAAQQRMAEPEVSESLSGAPQPAYINVTALATRLPHWKLAEQIEKSGEIGAFFVYCRARGAARFAPSKCAVGKIWRQFAAPIRRKR